MKIVKESLAGTFESSDLLVKVAPADGKLTVVINSEVIKQFGHQIKQVVNDTLKELGVQEGTIIVDDKGALDCVIRARVQSAVLRATDGQQIEWEKL
ncbi:citrate lyase acyl carrier protein [Pectobacterium atrosepticum SCRI1043]|uniref:Citrate lyase acyl carrier protein n=1 Tax=Pectobacterium atrosepticum (strain SCRI 1043 / ATCC BAA-672) TaxID=218491 RepID=CITD_PECAS|nr:citrate lyase acyl carrier protein [Pectobacterium atrosepticum]Q6D421.1 RecName: Full=Citrate lyase acyl carrier protein; AltName: Full=Citrate lyase gamma chain [Pectobacterium atrosepticum SCRI1043]GKV85101.1 citrate lyase acyl carrier protein [Pectobacterium carotovorum subsp. carotovorum]AIA71373.1 citrate lyase subunit gamma [Pectobacterium atrosepticum]AIK13806.1 citrate lyase acyl carrier protein [Pectobacterium atrosepticum]ATY90645.1 citrate lyase ACP [Pectobacterium atrosepticum]